MKTSKNLQVRKSVGTSALHHYIFNFLFLNLCKSYFSLPQIHFLVLAVGSLLGVGGVGVVERSWHKCRFSGVVCGLCRSADVTKQRKRFIYRVFIEYRFIYRVRV